LPLLWTPEAELVPRWQHMGRSHASSPPSLLCSPPATRQRERHTERARQATALTKRQMFGFFWLG